MAGGYKPVELAGELYRLGEVIQGERIKQGYRSAEKFCEAINIRTGIEIKPDTMQRFESGRQEPKISQYLAIALTLGKLTDPLLVESLPDELLVREIGCAIVEFQYDNPDVTIDSRLIRKKGREISVILSDGREAIITPFSDKSDYTFIERF